jgi:hypothetical protein
MMSSSTKAQSKQLLGVHAALRSKKPLTPQTLLEMFGKMLTHPGHFFYTPSAALSHPGPVAINDAKTPMHIRLHFCVGHLANFVVTSGGLKVQA